MKINVIIHGLNWSGSSAVYDLLREYTNVGYVPGEFDDFRRPGMIGDQLVGAYQAKSKSLVKKEISKKNQQYYRSLKRRVKKAINAKNGNKLRGFFHLINPKNSSRLFINEEVHKYWNKTKEKKIFLELNRALTAELPKEEKLKLARNWIQALGNIYAQDVDYLLFDQAILTTQHVNTWPKVFTPFKLIIIYRDPRDQLAELIRQDQLYHHMRSPIAAIYGANKEGAIKLHVEATKRRLTMADHIAKVHGTDKVLMIGFEKFITSYKKIKKEIEDFIGLKSSNHNYPARYLDPGKSKKNIGIFKKILSKKEIEMLYELQNWYNHKAKK